MPDFVLCHSRETRTFVTVRADNADDALAFVEPLTGELVDDPVLAVASHERITYGEVETTDPGEWEVREAQETLPEPGPTDES